MMRKILFVTAAGAVFLTGCNSEQTYGIASDRWAAMSPQEHSQIQSQYASTQTAIATEDSATVIKNPHTIRVAVYGGRALMPPFHWYQPYDKEIVDITEGTCETCTLTKPDGEKEVGLTLCYRDHELEIDPSKFVFEQRHGTVAFHESPEWTQGKTYAHVTSSGYARLKDAHIYVKQLS